MEEIYKYIESHAARPDAALDWVVKQTHIRTNHARMLSGMIQGQLLRMIVQISGAKRILELGTFTGFSAICLASGLPEDGHLDTLELNDELLSSRYPMYSVSLLNLKRAAEDRMGYNKKNNK